jgi:hypothetical protein
VGAKQEGREAMETEDSASPADSELRGGHTAQTPHRWMRGVEEETTCEMGVEEIWYEVRGEMWELRRRIINPAVLLRSL